MTTDHDAGATIIDLADARRRRRSTPYRRGPLSPHERLAFSGIIAGAGLDAQEPGYQELVDHLLYGDPLPAVAEPLRARCRALLRAISDRLEA